jgi:hypothetical protein
MSKDIVVRALKTAVQTFLASWALSGNQLNKTALVAAAAAAVSAFWNFVVKTA